MIAIYIQHIHGERERAGFTQKSGVRKGEEGEALTKGHCAGVFPWMDVGGDGNPERHALLGVPATLRQRVERKAALSILCNVSCHEN